MALSTLRTGRPPAWVEEAAQEPASPSHSEQETGGQLLTLLDTQVNAATAETFVHVIKEIVTEAGVQGGANLEFAWDPSYQELTLHQLRIERGTERLDRLDTSKFKIIQQETDLDRHIYNGTLSAVLFLEDVRVGDRIEYAYTLRGENPSLKGRCSLSFMTGLAAPVRHRRLRVLGSEGCALNFRLHGTVPEPSMRTRAGINEYAWDLHDVPAVVTEDEMPSWFPAYPWVQLSDFSNWSEVATWASGLFATTNLDAPELQEQLVNLWGAGHTAEQRVQAALAFAQTKIRYLGIEFGPHSYRPTDPVTVLRRRFGDCKDKAFLLCALVRGLGYEATPVLVATGWRQTLPELLPAPHDFDHVIVRVTADGATYWLDPTRSYQRGPIAQRYRPDYGFGLLARPGETQLTPIPRSGTGIPETATAEVFRIGSQKAPAQLSVTTTFRGYDAEVMRAVLNSGGRERMAKSYLNDYAQRYPGVVPAAPMAVEDSSTNDTLILTHTYSITNFWVLAADKEHYSCQFYPLGIHTWTRKPATAVRSTPMDVSFPRRRLVQTRLELPREFTLSNFTNSIAGPAAELRLKRHFSGQTVWLDYDYRALTNFVPVSRIGKHLSSLDRMEEALGYSLTWQNMETIAHTSQFNWPIFLLASLYTAMLATGAGLLCRYQCKLVPTLSSVPPPLIEPQLSGLGGWLILVAINLVVGPLRVVVNLNQTAGSFTLWKWHALTSPGGLSYQPGWGPLLTFELLGQLTIVTLNLFLLVLFFQKRRIFPRWFIALMVLNTVVNLLDALGVQFLIRSSKPMGPEQFGRLMQPLIASAIWIPYMCVSRRVKATFVR